MMGNPAAPGGMPVVAQAMPMGAPAEVEKMER